MATRTPTCLTMRVWQDSFRASRARRQHLNLISSQQLRLAHARTNVGLRPHRETIAEYSIAKSVIMTTVVAISKSTIALTLIWKAPHARWPVVTNERRWGSRRYDA